MTENKNVEQTQTKIVKIEDSPKLELIEEKLSDACGNLWGYFNT